MCAMSCHVKATYMYVYYTYLFIFLFKHLAVRLPDSPVSESYPLKWILIKSNKEIEKWKCAFNLLWNHMFCVLICGYNHCIYRDLSFCWLPWIYTWIWGCSFKKIVCRTQGYSKKLMLKPFVLLCIFIFFHLQTAVCPQFALHFTTHHIFIV